MIRLHCIVEGQTEKAFIDRILAPHLATIDIFADARPVYTSWKLQKKGGMTSYAKAKRDIEQWMLSDQNPDVWFTTMFDLYALPSDFPKFNVAKEQNNPYLQVAALESALENDVKSRRLIPYIQLHEFEALLFADIAKLDWEFLEHEHAINNLIELSKTFNSPELINDHPTTAPSKRIIQQIPEYERAKTSVAPLVTEKIGLTVIRERCLHFNEWVTKLENLAI